MDDYIKRNTHVMKLRNGLNVISVNYNSQLVAVQLWVKVGSRNESDDEAGLSHLCEHLLFKGVVNRSRFDFAQFIESRGGEVNAWTSHDDTVYHFVIPIEQFEASIKAVSFLLQIERWYEEDIKNEIGVITEEIIREEESPFSYLSKIHYETAFRTHPYKRPILGYKDTVSSFTHDKIYAYYKKWYQPSNIVLVIVGPVGHKKVERVVGKYIAPLGEGSTGFLESKIPKEQLQLKPRVRGVGFVSTLGMVELSFKGTQFKNNDTPLLDLAIYILGEGRGSRLVQRLVEKRKLLSAYGYNYTPIDQGLVFIGATLKPKSFIEGLEYLFKEIVNFVEDGVTYNEVERAIKNYKITRTYSLETCSALAKTVALNYIYGGKVEYEAEYQRVVEEAQLDDYNRVIQKYIIPERLTLTYLLPVDIFCDEGKGINNKIRELIKECWRGGERELKKKITIIPKSALTTQNYLRYVVGDRNVLLLRRDKKVPIISLSIGTYGGVRSESKKNNGVSYLASILCTKSTKNYSHKRLAERLEEFGLSVSGFSGKNLIGLSFTAVTEFLDYGIEILREILFYPQFKRLEFIKERERLIEEHRFEETRPFAVAWNKFYKELFREHPYSMPIKGDRESLSNLTENDVKEFYFNTFKNNKVVVSISGNFKEKIFFELIEDITQKQNPLKVKENFSILPVPEKKIFIEKVQKELSYVIYGFLGTSFINRDKYGLEIIEEYLGSQTGRLFYRLREERGLVYSFGCRNVEGMERGFFAIHASTSSNNVEEVIKIIEEEINSLIERPISKSKLRQIKEYLYGSNLISLQTNKAHALNMMYGELYEYGYLEYLNYKERIREWDEEKLWELSKSYFKENPVIVIATDREDIRVG